MQAIREVKHVKGKKVTIDLPEDFGKGKVEVIVLPYIETSVKKKNIENLLMKGPSLTDKEIQSFQKIKKTKRANALLDVDKITIDTGISDLSNQHDHYLYGVPKK